MNKEKLKTVWRERIKKHFWLGGLAVIWGIIVWRNFTPGTYLAGWDNLVPELNISLNLKRSWAAVWQEYQGVGLVGGHGHAADLVRQLILLPLVWLLPNNWIRYWWHFGMMALGSAGVYVFLADGGLGRKKEDKGSAFLGALFYLLNFGTIQIFWPPYESFTTFWGFFPWLIWAFGRVMTKPEKKNWRRLAVVNLLATPSFYIPTLFWVYFLCLLPTAAVFLKKKGRMLWRAAGLILAVNAFWLLPFGYFLLTNAYHPQEATINLMSSEETFLRNQKRGTIGDFLQLKGYYADFFDSQGPLMGSWQEWLERKEVVMTGYLLGAMVAVGAFWVAAGRFLGLKRRRMELAGLGIWLVSGVALLSASWPFSWLNGILRQLPLVNQAFRSPFTKFVAPAAFSFSVLLVWGWQAVEKKWPRLVWGKLVTAGLILFLAWPVFQGKFLYSQMRVTIPEEYFELMEFFKSQPKTARIANLPQGGFWGWSFYRWGYRGSGFIWYGIEQPILDRAFDVWNLANEGYYREVDYALQSRNIILLEQVLEKYFVEFVVFDDNVYAPGSKEFAKLALGTEELLAESSRLKKVASFGEIDVFRFDRPTRPAVVLGELPRVGGFRFTQMDPIFEEKGDYRVEETKPEVFYPFAGLTVNRPEGEKEFEVEETDNFWLIKRDWPDFEGEGGWRRREAVGRTVSWPVAAEFGEVPAEKVTEMELGGERFGNSHHCAPEKPEGRIEFKNEEGVLELRAREAVICVDWQDNGFLGSLEGLVGIELEFEYLSGSDEWPQYCFWDEKGGNCLNGKDEPSQGFSPVWQKFTERLVFDSEKEKLTSLALLLDAYGETEEKVMKYREVKVQFYELDREKWLGEGDFSLELEEGEDELMVKVPKVVSPWFSQNPLTENLFKNKARSCNFSLTGEYDLEVLEEEEKKFLRLSSVNDDACLSWDFPYLPLDQGWLVEIEWRHRQGYPLLVSGVNEERKEKFFYTQLGKETEWQKSYLVIAPRRSLEAGMEIFLSSPSFNRGETINDLAGIRMIPLPWEYLKGLSYEREGGVKAGLVFPEAEGQLWRYVLTLGEEETADGSGVILPQAFDRGWVGLVWQKGRLKFLEHFLVNNWANGWRWEEELEVGTKIYLIFWPQLLEWLGLGLGLGVMAAVGWRARRKK